MIKKNNFFPIFKMHLQYMYLQLFLDQKYFLFFKNLKKSKLPFEVDFYHHKE